MQTVRNLAILGIVALAVPVQADDVETMKPVTSPPVLMEWIDPVDRPITDQASGPVADPAAMNDACPATNLGTLSSAGGSWSGDTTGLANNFEFDYPQPCTYSVFDGSGADEIFEFQVDTAGIWDFDTCTVPAGWNISLGIRVDTGGGCPGDPLVCDGDNCFAGAYEAAVSAFLTTGTDYFMVVDGYRAHHRGPYTISYAYVPPCEEYPDPDAYCSDGEWCNGEETCNAMTHFCETGTPPCLRAHRRAYGHRRATRTPTYASTLIRACFMRTTRRRLASGAMYSPVGTSSLTTGVSAQVTWAANC